MTRLSFRSAFALVSACTLLGIAAEAEPVRSAPIQALMAVDILHWNTIRQAHPVLRWEWPDEAESASVTVSSFTREKGRTKTSAFIVNRGESDIAEWTLPVDLPAQEQDTGVVMVSLDFYRDAGGSGATIPGATLKTDMLGLVRGVSGDSLRMMACDESEKIWSREEVYKGVVLPILPGTVRVTVDGDDMDIAGVPGWACAILPAWRDVVFGLSAESGCASATLYREGPGAAVILR